ncbi:MAG: hypothetical protein U9R72_16075 [Chloroflexota bacterium]|nr:hypothetical protein [Chloroflexota bacterium]
MKRFGLLFGMMMTLFLPLASAREADAREGASLQAANSPLSSRAAVSAASVDWLEPRGLNVVDMVGQVPEEHLKGAILSFTPGYGIVTYESGTRTGDWVTIRATVFPRYVEDGSWWGSLFGCLGQPARIDQWGSISPATTVRLYHGSKDVTSEVDLYSYVPAGRNLPVRNPEESENQNRYRYWENGEWSPLSTSFTGDGALRLPANMGCELIMSYTNYERLTAVFNAQVRREVSVEVVGTQEFTFRSYLGAGYAGLLEKLAGQLKERYDGRHDKFKLNIPPDADYFFLNFPMMPVDAYTRFRDNPYDNVGRPSGGTYRIDGAGLSVDHVNAMGLPLYGHWKDSGSSDDEYLPHFRQPGGLAAPEYFVPYGVGYDPCMLKGTCPDSVLEKIWETRMTMTAVYLQVERIAGGMDQIPLRMVGPDWDVSAAGATSSRAASSAASPSASTADTATLDHSVYLPLALRYYWSSIPADEPGDQPYGWFTEDGRMLDFVPLRQ